MSITKYHAKYFSYELTRSLPSNDIGKLTASLHDAQVDLNPHQIEAALFAFQSPLSNGAILADEVGLGKTIEAGIILSQQWAERKRKLLIIAPSNLRKQWNQELMEKFFLPSGILESKTFNKKIKKGALNPFNLKDNIVICSYHFAKNKADYIRNVNWDLVIIDEAHRLRNVYKPSNKIGNAIKEALVDRKKVLLTATPLQNSILELYGLTSIIDDYLFGDLKSFKAQYSRQLDEGNYEELKQRIQPICKRTLRRQVLEYIRYTKRIAIREEFYPTRDEQQLYEWVSEYLQRPVLYALPNSQRQLMTLILRKLLASSTYAIQGTLDSLVNRLESMLKRIKKDLSEELNKDFETFGEIQDEWDSENIEEVNSNSFSEEDFDAILEELKDLKKYRNLAIKIKKNSKAEHLFTALEKGFTELEKLGANQKALIFTESRRTQEFLVKNLEEKGYRDKVVQFNGSNTDSKSKEIYKGWLEKHKGTDKITGSPTADKRASLVDYFKEEATIMVATEAAAEGINLQFCSLIVNFDLPWNPQRIEQRIGRCHRYGQNYDVVVVNFLNKANAADQRVYELLDEKFQIFNGVFGASDEVLGTIGNGVDFEKRISEIYNNCRTPEAIEEAFDKLQNELKPQISEKVQSIRTTLLENFDEEVREKLKMNLEQSQAYLNAFEQKLWKTTAFALSNVADFSEKDYSFSLNYNPFPKEKINLGHYKILKSDRGNKSISTPENTNIYRIGHKLAQALLNSSKKENTFPVELKFDYSNTPTKVTNLEKYVGQVGWMQVTQLSINSLENEDYILIGCFTEKGDIIHPEDAQRFFSLQAHEGKHIEPSENNKSKCAILLEEQKQEIIAENALRNRDFFDEKMDKLDQWADDMKLSLEKEIKDLDAEIKLKKSEAKKMMNLEAKVKAQRQIKDLEKKRSFKRQSLFTAQDEIDEKKENLLEDIEKMLNQNIDTTELFTIKWNLI